MHNIFVERRMAPDTKPKQAEIKFFVCRDTFDNRSYRLCLHFKSHEHLLGFWEFCEKVIQTKIDNFYGAVFTCFKQSESEDFEKWLSKFDKDTLFNLFLANNIPGIQGMLGGSAQATPEGKFNKPDQACINKIKQKFSVSHHNTGMLSNSFDLLVTKPIYFSNSVSDLLISQLHYYGHRSNPESYVPRLDGVRFESMIVEEQFSLVRSEIGCNDLDWSKMKSPYVQKRRDYIIPKENLDSVYDIICPPLLNQHLTQFQKPSDSSCVLM